jgi:hypothetical protein
VDAAIRAVREKLGIELERGAVRGPITPAVPRRMELSGGRRGRAGLRLAWG